ncbi:acylphosphatase-2 isoform X3 [Tamandua tetradactyla]|uniref:acylphosphatase-2 isoform X3 n=1 Tax=Tamandua tetradactyla TaxID=48850 RepID=UPI00405384EA
MQIPPSKRIWNFRRRHVINSNIQNFWRGVCFRMYTEEEAKKLGVVGWVKNTSKGTVAGQVQGPEEKVNSMWILITLLESFKRGSILEKASEQHSHKKQIVHQPVTFGDEERKCLLRSFMKQET